MKSKKNRSSELINDPNFSTGFNVMGYSSVDDGRKIVYKLDYNGNAKISDKPIWFMSQWWTPYNLINSRYEYIDDNHVYSTPSRSIHINPKDNGFLKIELSGTKEYFGVPRKSLSDSWPHALIEQTFSSSIRVNDVQNLFVGLDVCVDYSVDNNGEFYNPNIHAAQLLWYFTLSNNISNNNVGLGKPGDYLWLGVPIYDSRFPYLKEQSFLDEGSPGTTSKLIYSIDSSEYLGNEFIVGKTYNIKIDILTHFKKAFSVAKSKGALIDCMFENMVVNYMNFGWELPGMFDVSATIRNLSVEVIYKK